MLEALGERLAGARVLGGLRGGVRRYAHLLQHGPGALVSRACRQEMVPQPGGGGNVAGRAAALPGAVARTASKGRARKARGDRGVSPEPQRCGVTLDDTTP